MKKVEVIFFTIFILVSISTANPLVNQNIEDTEVYDNAITTERSEKLNVTIKPFSGYKTLFLLGERERRIKQYLNTFEYPVRYIKPINSVTTKVYITNEEYSFIEGQGGLGLRKGVNVFLFEDGLISLGERAVVYYQLRQNWNKEKKVNEFYRWYLKFRFYKFSLELGRDSVSLGPGEYGMLLSNNAPPFPMVKLQTEEPLEFIGKWDLVFLRGWLPEDRRDVDSPNVLALRVVWKPAEWIEIGGTKTTLYGGEGRPGYSLLEYWELITSSRDNIPGDKFNNDSMASVDVSFYLPLYKWFPSIKFSKFYIQQAGTDIAAIWQEDDEKKIRLPYILFKFEHHSLQTGILIGTQKSIYRLEYAYTDESMFIHSNYPFEGFSFKGFVLGYPYGKSIQTLFFKQRSYLKEDLSFEYKIGFIKQPFDEEDIQYPLKMRRYFLQTSINKKWRNFILEGFFRVDKTDNYNKSRIPVQFDIVDEDKTLYIIGCSLSYRI